MTVDLSARRKTALLTVGLAAMAAGLSLTSVLNGAPVLARPELTLALVAGFYACEHYIVDIEFRRQSYSFTLSAVPLIVGLLELPLHDVVLARLAGSAVALLIQRIAADKFAYNLASWVCEAAVAGTVVDAFIKPRHLSTLATLGCVLVVVVLADLALSCLVLVVITFHGAAVTRDDIRAVLLTALTLNLLAGSYAGALSLLLEAGPGGAVLAALLVGTAALVYKHFALAQRRHHALSTMHEFVTGNRMSDLSGADPIASAVTDVRRILRAACVELITIGPASEDGSDHADTSRYRVDEHDDVTVVHKAALPVDALRTSVLAAGSARLIPATVKDAELRTWLGERDAKDAIIVALTDEQKTIGLLTVTDRLGDVPTFTRGDLDLCSTLAGHLSVSMSNARLLDRLAHDASHDPLTGLANRALLSRRIEANRADQRAVLLLDLDKFKEVNDVLGHEVGDRLLVVVAERLRRCTGDNGLVARLGGDEFAILMAGEHAGDLAVHALAERVCEVVSEPVVLAEAVLTPEASVGIAIGRRTATTAAGDDLLRQADTAMYAAKAARSHVQVYTAQLDEGRAEQLSLASDLKLALAGSPEQFVVYYQPKVDLRTRAVVSCEALVRWLHPVLGAVAPERFVPLAETTGLIDKLTQRVLEQALTDCATWKNAGHDVTVAVNLSAGNLSGDTLEMEVLQTLAATGTEAADLILEVTETSVMSDPDRAINTLERLSGHGVTISLDDFGTGYSSLAYLQRLPVSELKIDRSFVGALGEDGSVADALVGAVLALAHGIGIRVVAEGIENEHACAMLTEANCEIGQGYLFSRPTALPLFIEQLDSTRLPNLELVS